MIFPPRVLCAGLFLLACSTVVQAHQVAGGTHKHVWRPTTYGSDYRPGHSVNSPAGSITIWSPAALNEYGADNSVNFAHPDSFKKPSPNQSGKQSLNQIQGQSSIPRSGTTRSGIPVIKSLAPSRYGKDYKRDYGK